MTTRRLALLSVTDKTGLVAFAAELKQAGFEILSTGGTARALQEGGIEVTPVESYTGSPEVMAGRVKTLHPRVHGGILARAGADDADLARIGGGWIEMVVVNLYAFERTAARTDATFEEIIENIDIGGPSMLRSAAKNHARVTVVCDPSDYELVASELKSGGAVTQATRSKLAAKAFARTAAYDAAIAGYLSAAGEDGKRDAFPQYLGLNFERAYKLRYGENPHQSGAFYRELHPEHGTVAGAESLGAGGKELSFNNLVDVDAALEAVREFEGPAAVVVKHTNPCGVATAASLVDAYRIAREADATSAYGGIVALNREVDEAAAQVLGETFLEAIIAPSFSEVALALLKKKKNLRLLSCGPLLAPDHPMLVYRRISGGLVVQDRDASSGGEVKAGKVVSKRAPTADELAALDFAWRVVKHVKSNAIVLAKKDVTVGVGAGQMSRVESVRIACHKAGDLARGSVLGSDAFFPFPDGVELAASHGVTAIVQPGGSVKDEAVIEAVDKAGLAMIFTGKRHFRH